MQTDKIRIRNNGDGAKEALDETARFATYAGMDDKTALRLRLLSEEMLGMVRAIAGDFEADFWLESSEEKVCLIHLLARTNMDYAKRRELINTSTDKKNAASKGFMGKIRELVERGLYSMDEAGHLSMEYGSTPMMHGAMYTSNAGAASMSSYIYQWSLEKYRQGIHEAGASEVGAAEAWDELEKSIVANIADDVRVGIRGNTVELVIEKRLG